MSTGMSSWGDDWPRRCLSRFLRGWGRYPPLFFEGAFSCNRGLAGKSVAKPKAKTANLEPNWGVLVAKRAWANRWRGVTLINLGAFVVGPMGPADGDADFVVISFYLFLAGLQVGAGLPPGLPIYIKTIP
mmetsp:Transcript_74988/g.132437  ORF Transcript_74988/g.132437 Transcript_74988/m.132437 type:complete len:130 (-) Transcript_74988:265-654(-)